MEHTAQRECILRAGLLNPITQDDLQLVLAGGIGEFRRVVGEFHSRLCELNHRVVVHRGDEAIRGWRSWLKEDPSVHPCKWLRLDMVPPVIFLECQPHLTPGDTGVLADPARIDEEFRQASLWM